MTEWREAVLALKDHGIICGTLIKLVTSLNETKFQLL